MFWHSVPLVSSAPRGSKVCVSAVRSGIFIWTGRVECLAKRHRRTAGAVSGGHRRAVAKTALDLRQTALNFRLP